MIDGVILGVTVDVFDGVIVLVTDGVGVVVGVFVGVPVLVGVTVGLIVVDGVGVRVGVTDGVGVCDAKIISGVIWGK